MSKKQKVECASMAPLYQRPKDPTHDAALPRHDPTSGQRPGIYIDDSDQSDEETAGAFAYLRSVRHEARGIPNVLVAPSNKSCDDGNSDSRAAVRGYYGDGAYVAVQRESPSLDTAEHLKYDDDIGTSEIHLVEPATAYHSCLLNRYNDFRAQLRRHPASISPSKLPTPQATHLYPNLDRMAEAKCWEKFMTASSPLPAELRKLDQDEVLGLLDILPVIMKGTKWTQGDGRAGRNMSAWIWGLLVMAKERGTLIHDEVSVLREVGKRAGSIVLGLETEEADARDMEEWSGVDERDVMETVEEIVDGDAAGDDAFGQAADTDPPAILPRRRRNSSSDIECEDEVAMLEETRARLLAQHVRSVQRGSTARPAKSAKEKTQPCNGEEALKATLDMVLTIVGEFYGQRDLLVARDRLWV